MKDSVTLIQRQSWCKRFDHWPWITDRSADGCKCVYLHVWVPLHFQFSIFRPVCIIHLSFWTVNFSKLDDALLWDHTFCLNLIYTSWLCSCYNPLCWSWNSFPFNKWLPSDLGFIQKWKFSHHLHNLMLFQTCMLVYFFCWSQMGHFYFWRTSMQVFLWITISSDYICFKKKKNKVVYITHALYSHCCHVIVLND